MANATAPWRHITIPMSHPLTHTQQQAYRSCNICSLICVFNAQNHWDNCLLVKRQSFLFRILPFLEASSRVKQSFSNNILLLYCFWLHLWLIVVCFSWRSYYSRPTMQVASDGEKLAPGALRFESPDTKSIINLSITFATYFHNNSIKIKWEKVEDPRS
jgi:hypothetical protein